MISSSQQVNDSTIKWSYTAIQNLNTSETLAAQGYFITYPSAKIEWVQKNGTRNSELEVTSSIGNWNDRSSLGEITYQVKFRNGKGTVKILRKEDGVFLFLDLDDFGGAPLRLIFPIHSSDVL